MLLTKLLFIIAASGHWPGESSDYLNICLKLKKKNKKIKKQLIGNAWVHYFAYFFTFPDRWGFLSTAPSSDQN